MIPPRQPEQRIEYWVKCDRDPKPVVVWATTLYELLEALRSMMEQRGPIEFMVRK